MNKSYLLFTVCMLTGGMIESSSALAQSYPNRYEREVVRPRPVTSNTPRYHSRQTLPEGYGYQGYRAPAPVQTQTQPVTTTNITTALPAQMQSAPRPATPSQQIGTPRVIPAPVIAPQPVPVAAAPVTLDRQEEYRQAATSYPKHGNSSRLPQTKQAGWQEFVPTNLREVRTHSIVNATVYTGYRVDELDWNIAGNVGGTSPNILSELTWSDLKMYEFGGTISYTHPEGFFQQTHVEASGSYASIYSGDNQDSDYLADDRTEEFSRSNNNADDGSATSFKVAAGYEFNTNQAFHPDSTSTNSWITPMLGYSRQTLDLTITDGVQTLPPTGPFPGLDSSYDTEWQGPFAAIKAGMHSGNHRLEGRGEFHYADYEAAAQWNLRTDFNQPVSFVHSGSATGIELGLDYSYLFWGNFGVNAGVNIKAWSVEDGNVATIFRNGIALATQLNEVSWNSQLYRVGLAYNF